VEEQNNDCNKIVMIVEDPALQVFEFGLKEMKKAPRVTVNPATPFPI
jgi:hypothetical protein